MKQFNIDNFLYYLNKKFDTFLIEIAENANNRINENRLNTFLINFELLREKCLQIKQEERKKLKLNTIPKKCKKTIKFSYMAASFNGIPIIRKDFNYIYIIN
jgi:hypothetical protein